jgi:glycosyltransferase involved in cell wall biosynthesis
MSMIPNGADLDLLEPGPKENAVRRKLGLEGQFVVSYFGAHGRANALDQLLDAAALVKDEMPDVRFLLVGDGPVKGDLAARAGREGLTNVVFADAVAKAEVADYINASDVCTATLLNIEHFKMYYPNKVFDYMCCARPIIIAIDGVARELVEKAGAGLFAEPENSRAFREALDAMRRDPEAARRMGESGRRFVVENFSRRMLAERLLEIVTGVAEGSRAS